MKNKSVWPLLPLMAFMGVAMSFYVSFLSILIEKSIPSGLKDNEIS